MSVGCSRQVNCLKSKWTITQTALGVVCVNAFKCTTIGFRRRFLISQLVCQSFRKVCIWDSILRRRNQVQHTDVFYTFRKKNRRRIMLTVPLETLLRHNTGISHERYGVSYPWHIDSLHNNFVGLTATKHRWIHHAIRMNSFFSNMFVCRLVFLYPLWKFKF